MNKTLKMSILAVIVTHNRCTLLSRCIDHLQIQTRQAQEILVINNASTDGTVEMLQGRGIPFVTQENVGSAGGWHRGIEHAVDQGFDAVWLMDDDGFPDPTSLAELEARLITGVAAVSAVVVREDERARFVFPFPLLDAAGLPVLIGSPRKLFTVTALKAMATNGTYPFAHFFNGALISVNAVRKIGNVNRDFYISGDEVDYFFRLRKAGSVLSVIDALHFHPDVSQRPYSSAKFYYYLKNTLILNGRYFNAIWLRHLLAVIAVLGRTASRNGVMTALSFVFGTQSRTFYMAIARGLQGKVGKDFNG
jgi:rhamnopyranosyl-N-acetylglucosaminyl-diphospho-decaprenol beta-1,3/1,4-galactofuranosyltransferase